MFSSTKEFDRISLQLQTNDYQLSVTTQKWKNLCKSKVENTKILEAFQDNIDKEVKEAGAIFCEPLNGRLIEFPKTLDELQKVNAFNMKIKPNNIQNS